MAEIADPLIIRLKPNQNPVARDFLKLALSIAGGAAVILTPIVLMNQNFHVRNAIFFGAIIAVAHTYRLFLFGMYINARSEEETLIFTKESFLDTRMFDEPISWSDISAIERNSSNFCPDGLFITLSKSCSFSAEFLDSAIARLLFGKFEDKRRIFISFSGLNFDGDKLADIFATKSAHAIEPAKTGGGYGGL